MTMMTANYNHPALSKRPTKKNRARKKKNKKFAFHFGTITTIEPSFRYIPLADMIMILNITLVHTQNPRLHSSNGIPISQTSLALTSSNRLRLREDYQRDARANHRVDEGAKKIRPHATPREHFIAYVETWKRGYGH